LLPLAGGAILVAPAENEGAWFLGVRIDGTLRPSHGLRLIGVTAAVALLATSGALADASEPPPPDQTVEATSPSGAVVTYSEAVWDCTPDSGTTFPLGVRSVSCTAPDQETGDPLTATFTVTVQDTTPPVVTTPGALSQETADPAGTAVSFATSASDAVDGTLSPDCTRQSGSPFPIGTTTVTCSATDAHNNTGSASFTVTVTLVDTTAPVVTVPANIAETTTVPGPLAVSFPAASATDNLDGALTPVCTHASGSPFPIGTTTVTCSATDAHNNTGSASFTVTVTLVDTTAPVVTVPANISETTTVPGPLVVSFSASATDNLDGALTPLCTHASGSPFPIGTTMVTCSATDAHNNTGSSSFPVTVTLVDTTAPVVMVPGPITAEAQGPDGARVTFTASATDNLDGAMTPTCSPSSGSTFRRGTTTVTCSVADAARNNGTASFTVTIADTTAPALVLPSALIVEANSPLGSIVTFTVSAVDVADGPLPPTAVRCTPASGNRFPLGRTLVQCRATDTSANVATKDLTVSVVDSTAPVLTVPAPIALTATAAGLPASDPAIARFLGGATAEDMVDSRPTLRHDAPAVFPLGQTTVTFVATDSFGNWQIAKSTVTLTVRPTASPPPAAADRIPPDNVSALRAERGNARVRLRWRRPPTPDFDRVEILRSENQAGAAQTRVFRGSETTFLDRSLVNGIAYRYVVVSYDRTGNRSAGVAIVATPKATMLLRPLEGARIAGRPTLAWARAPGATYYNLQLYRGSHKALTLWLKGTSFKLKRQWTFAGRRERLRPGFYRWYVWPGTGDPALGDYGPMLGESSFTIVR
jgi:hypothetical protein